MALTKYPSLVTFWWFCDAGSPITLLCYFLLSLYPFPFAESREHGQEQHQCSGLCQSAGQEAWIQGSQLPGTFSCFINILAYCIYKLLFSRILRVRTSHKFPLQFMSVYSNENISKITKLSPRKFPHLVQNRENICTQKLWRTQ